MKENIPPSGKDNKGNLEKEANIEGKLLREMLDIPNFLTYDLVGKGIEVKPGRFSSIFINMKTTWAHPEVLLSISKRLTELCKGCDCIIGIETGGSPYAVSIARDLKSSLVLARKEVKEQSGFLAGCVNGKEKKIAVVDDVLATGKSSEKGFFSVKNNTNHICLVSVLSYGMDDLISKKYDIEVKSLYQIDDLLNALDPSLKIKLIPHIRSYQDKLRKIINS